MPRIIRKQRWLDTKGEIDGQDLIEYETWLLDDLNCSPWMNDILGGRYVSLAKRRIKLNYLGEDLEKTRSTLLKRLSESNQSHDIIYFLIIINLHSYTLEYVIHAGAFSEDIRNQLININNIIKDVGVTYDLNDVLTPHKISSAFPEITCRLAPELKKIVGLDPDVLPSYPYAMRHPEFASLIPFEKNDQIDEIKISKIKKAFVWHQTKCTFSIYKITNYTIQKCDLDAHEVLINKRIDNSHISLNMKLDFIKPCLTHDAYQAIETMADLYDETK